MKSNNDKTEIIRQDMLKSFHIAYYKSNINKEKPGAFFGNATIFDGEFEIKVNTENHSTPEEVLNELKKLIINAYVKIEK